MLRAGVDAVVLRVFNAIGPGVSPDSVLGRAATNLARAQRDHARATIELLDQDQYRDYIDAADVAEAVVAAALATLPRSHRLINIGTGEARTTANVVRLLADLSGADYHVARSRSVDPGRTAGAAWQRADPSRAHDLLGWSARTPLVQTLAALWAATAEPHPLHTRPYVRKAEKDD